MVSAFADRVEEADKNNKEELRKLLQEIKSTPPPGYTPPKYTPKDLKDVERDYRKQQRLREKRPSSPPLNPDEPMPFDQTAKECGESRQAACSPSKLGGRTMCGRAVAQMIECMAKTVSPGGLCKGNCGDGKDFVECRNQQMKECGYEKITPTTDSRCSRAGAVLAYSQSPTTRGRKFGHVEFVCGRGKYCSVYSQPHDYPWPRSPADSCWYPKNATADGKAGGPQ